MLLDESLTVLEISQYTLTSKRQVYSKYGIVVSLFPNGPVNSNKRLYNVDPVCTGIFSLLPRQERHR